MPESEPTRAYGPVEQADDTRQAQQQVANDAPVDVNPNALLAREQGRTIAQMGNEFAASAVRRDNIANAFMGTSMKQAAETKVSV